MLALGQVLPSCPDVLHSASVRQLRRGPEDEKFGPVQKPLLAPSPLAVTTWTGFSPKAFTDERASHQRISPGPVSPSPQSDGVAYPTLAPARVQSFLQPSVPRAQVSSGGNCVSAVALGSSDEQTFWSLHRLEQNDDDSGTRVGNARANPALELGSKINRPLGVTSHSSPDSIRLLPHTLTVAPWHTTACPG